MTAAADPRLDAFYEAKQALALQQAAEALARNQRESENTEALTRSYLMRPDYREVTPADLFRDEATARRHIALGRWASETNQVCPRCGEVAQHTWCQSINGWKCRNKACGKQFSLFAGTRLHGLKMSAVQLMNGLFHIVEAKDSISARELSAHMGVEYQSAYVFWMKVREALKETMLAEDRLSGLIQADAAYFLKYVDPGNVGTGASLASKKEQKNAGLNESGKTTAKVSERMHALVAFVQQTDQGRFKVRVAVIKTESQVPLLTLAQRFCTPDSVLMTDQHSAYNPFSGQFVDHRIVNHNKVFVDKAGNHTNYAENFFSRVRAAQHGAWHRLTIQNLEYYGWEMAWRLQMVGLSNKAQVEDLLKRLLGYGRAKDFGDYWRKGKNPRPKLGPSEQGSLREVPKNKVPVKTGRPKRGEVRPKPPERAKRAYVRRPKLSGG